MMPYRSLSYAWSEAYLGSISSVSLGSDGIIGKSAIIWRQMSKKMMSGSSVSSSTLSNSCSLFLPAILAPADLSLGRHLQPSEIISSAMDGPI